MFDDINLTPQGANASAPPQGNHFSDINLQPQYSWSTPPGADPTSQPAPTNNTPRQEGFMGFLDNNPVTNFFKPFAQDIAAPFTTNILDDANRQNQLKDQQTNAAIMAAAKTPTEQQKDSRLIANSPGASTIDLNQNVPGINDTNEQVAGNATKVLLGMLSGGSLGTAAGAESLGAAGASELGASGIAKALGSMATSGTGKLLGGKAINSGLLGTIGTGALQGALGGASTDMQNNDSAGQVFGDAAKQGGESAAISALLGTLVPALVTGSGKVAAKGLSLVTGSGQKGEQAINTIASGGDLGNAAMTGASGAKNDAGQALFQQAINDIDKGNINNGNAGTIDTSGIRTAAQDLLAQHGVNVQVAEPEELNAVQKWLSSKSNPAEQTKSSIMVPDGNGGYVQSANPNYASQNIALDQVAHDIDTKYFPGQRLTGTLVSNGRKNITGSDEAGMMQRLQGLVQNNGLIANTADNSSLSNDSLRKLLIGDKSIGQPGIVKQLFGLGSSEGGPSQQATAGNLYNIKKSIAGMYKQGSFFQPLQPGESQANSLQHDLKALIDSNLSNQSPLYKQALDQYNAYHGGQSLNNWVPGSVGNILNVLNDSQAAGKGLGAAAIDGGVAAAAGALGHLNPVTGALMGVASIPKLSAYGANIYGKGVQTGKSAGTNNLSPAIAALLSAIR